VTEAKSRTQSRGPLAPASLAARYRPDDLRLLTAEERERFVGPSDVATDWGEIAPRIAWELLYRKEPDLYVRLVAGERIHPGILEWLPQRVSRCVEVAAGTGRLTLDLVPRCRELIAVEPAAPLRGILERKLRGRPGVQVREGFFDAVPVPDACADLVISLSAFTPDPSHGGDAGLAELERVAAARGLIVLVWPADVEWFVRRGFEYVSFPGEMTVEFPSLKEAVEIATIFYPHAVEEIARRGSARVSYEVLGMNPPRDLVWRRS